MSRTFLIVSLVILLNYCNGARILGFVPTPSYSHQIFYQNLWIELAIRGHEIVLLTTDPMKDPSLKNLKEIDLNFVYDSWRKEMGNFIEASNGNKVQMMFLFCDVLHSCIERELEHAEVQALLKNETEQFDLVMSEILIPAGFAFSHRFKCPLIGMLSMDPSMFYHESVGNPTHSALYPQGMLPFEKDLSFVERLKSILFNTFLRLMMKYYIAPQENVIIKKYFGEDYPSVKELTESMDMIFINTNNILNNIRPITPATISIGGIHISKAKPLPNALKKFLDESQEGVIYFSLGSNIKTKNIPAETKEVIVKVLSEIPYKVLWKFEDEDMPTNSSNVKIMKWLPQQDVLRHPNIKVFVTQAGKQSLEEAFFSHVPMVAMPFFADQNANSKKIVSNGLGLTVDYKSVTVEEFRKVLLEVIENPKYRNKVKELAELVNDEPMTPLEKAVWWTEYVIRHKGAQHLKGPTIALYQYYYLDILGFTIISVSITLFAVYFMLKRIVICLSKFICKKNSKSSTKKNKDI